MTSPAVQHTATPHAPIAALLAARLASLGAELAETRRELSAARRRIDELIHRDPATGIANRTTILAELRSEIDQARRQERPLAVAVISLDELGTVRDSFGVEVADRLLRTAVERLREELRTGDRLGLLDGHEVMAVLPDSDAADLGRLLQRLHRATAAAPVEVSPGVPARLSVSIGGAPVRAAGDDATRALDRAHQALTRARELGGDRVVVR